MLSRPLVSNFQPLRPTHLFLSALAFWVTCPSTASCVLSDSLNLQPQPDGTTQYDDGPLRTGYRHLANNQSESALEDFEAAAKRYRIKQDWIGYVASMNEIVRILYESQDLDHGFEIMDQLLVEGPEKLNPNHVLIGDLFFHYGELLYKSAQMDEALAAHQKALKIRQSKGESTLPVASSYYSLGNVYRFGDYNKERAEEYYLKALKIWDQLLPPNSHLLAECYYSLATTQRLKGDYEKGIVFATQTVQIYQQSPPSDITRLSNAFIAISNNYFLKNDFQNAIDYAQRAIDLVVDKLGPETDVLAYYYNSLGVNFQNVGDPERAIEAIGNALAINLKDADRNRGRIAHNYANLAILMEDLNLWDSAFYYHRSSVDLMDDYYGSTHTQTVTSIILLGQYYESTGVYDSALSKYHQAAVRSLPEFASRSVLDLPPKELVTNNPQVAEIFKLKGDILKKMYFERRKNIDLLRSALDNYLLSQHTIALNRKSYETEGAKLFQAESQKEVYENSLDCVYWLLQEEADPNYLRLAFDFMEKSKSILLLESLNDAEAYNLAGVEPSLKAEEIKLKERMGKLLFQLGQERSLSSPNQATVRELEGEIFAISREQDKLKETLRDAYPNYFDIKYNLDTVGLQGIQSLLRQEKATLVEFFWGQQAIYGLSLTGRQGEFMRIASSPALVEQIETFYRETSTIPKGLEVDPQMAASIARTGYKLYQLLLEPLLSNLPSNHRLVVVSDGPLTSLPFEALILRESNPAEAGFHLPYLLLEYPTSYAYSANLYFKNNHTPLTESSLDLLAFSYSDQRALSLETGSLEILRGLGYNELPGAAKELKAIASLMDGKFFWGEDATETNFKLSATQYDLLHLAIHGEGGQGPGSETRLVFRSQKDTANDGALYPHELYTMPIKARLVVLSACETGMGKYHSGEGMFSMARAFAYSGNPSLIATFWKINDNTTYRLISTLYQDLLEGKFIDQALQNAKVSYLESAMGTAAHPANWAALVVFGNSSPIRSTRESRIWFWVIAASLLVAGGAFYYLRKTSIGRENYFG